MPDFPAFIGGFRSGSTLLVNYLGLHPSISAIYETKFLADLLRISRLLLDEDGRGRRELALLSDWVGDPALTREKAIEFLIQRALEDISLTQKVLEGSAPDGKAPHERYAMGSNHILWTEQEALQAIGPFLREARSGNGTDTLLPSLASGIERLFALHAGREGKRYWVNKTPEILRFIPELLRMFGRVRFVHLIRDGRDVVYSSSQLKWWSVAAGARWWKLFIEDVRTEASRCRDDYRELRYEEFVRDHVDVLRSVLDFLQIEGAPEEIIRAQERHVPGSTRGGASGLTGRWRSEMSGGDRTAFKAVANDLLVTLGYASDSEW